MNIRIKNIRLRQWLWFVGLWCAGLAAALSLGYSIKYLISLI